MKAAIYCRLSEEDRNKRSEADDSEVFSLFAQGYGKTAISRILNNRGIPNPTEYKRLQGLRYRRPKSKAGTLWKYSAVSDMLTNEIYIGNMVQGKYGSISYKAKINRPRAKNQWYIVQGTHEPIVSRELWDRVQSMLAERTKPFSGGAIGLFAGKARCMYCGYTLRSSQSHGIRYLQCPNRHVAEAACIGSFIAVDRLQQAVLAELNRLVEEFLDQRELERLITCRSDSEERSVRIKKSYPCIKVRLKNTPKLSGSSIRIRQEGLSANKTTLIFQGTSLRSGNGSSKLPQIVGRN